MTDSSNKSLRFALIGCSAIARKHATALARIQGAELVASCDLEQSRAQAIADEFGGAAFAGHEQMLDSTDVDVVSVLTPSGLHAEHVLDLLRFGKHIVVEKPLTLRLEDADAVIQGCDRVGVKLFVVKQNRYNLPIRAVHQALEAGRFGKLVMGSVSVRWCRPQEYYDRAPWRGTWALDGGVLTNQGSHHLDMLTWLMGDVESVMAMTATRLARIETEDTAVCTLRFSSGALGMIEATTATRPRDLVGSISILGEHGSAVVGGFAMNELVTWQFTDERPEDATIFETHGKNPGDFAWNHTEYLRGVVETVTGGGQALVDGLEGRRSLELIGALYESAETGREVPLRFRPKRCRLGMRDS